MRIYHWKSGFEFSNREIVDDDLKGFVGNGHTS